VCAYNPSTTEVEVEVGRSGDGGQPGLHSKFPGQPELTVRSVSKMREI
jgi:hypothetical protein